MGLEAECVFSGAESEMHVLLLFGRLGLAGWTATRQRGLWFHQDMSVTFLERFDVIGKVLALQRTGGSWSLTGHPFTEEDTEAQRVEVNFTTLGLSALNSPPVSVLLVPFPVWGRGRERECRCVGSYSMTGALSFGT